ncbi:tRNA pseudouridine(38-40) synthase TruA [Uruburuella testudinis]|uniref:tRNA pseudouridine synthase A n=1 Tax=Uruburuella testudinis TaxID=1282863 RepID=A0ABY4DS28_9NEIS|nr:tRNA pseudouridine(38-40) synthase TruA [Uruburuella testudinis]UOO81525.1 tRNA pseudouridine(38-40) synthase TruA [Uruburuella testudinis]
MIRPSETIEHRHDAQRWALTLAYDGSLFYGWQKQADGTATVQTALEQALSQIAGTQIHTIAAGRTDTGVHATAQVVHFDTTAIRPQQAWVRGVNALLPAGVAVCNAQPVDSRFHARFDAFGRRYRYVLQVSAVRSPLLYGRAGWIHTPLDINAMQQAAALLEGEHDFSSFRAAACQAKSPQKTLYRAQLGGRPELITLDLHGNAFLHHMVRNIMGALVYVGNGRLSVAGFADLMEARSRLKAPPTFMPDGLYLTGVDYPPHWGVATPPPPEWLWSGGSAL